jgi:Tfp pilus assembly protein PilZ
VGAKVAWRRTEYQDSQPAGIGVAFHNISQGDKEAIRHFIDAALSRKI